MASLFTTPHSVVALWCVLMIRTYWRCKKGSAGLVGVTETPLHSVLNSLKSQGVAHLNTSPSTCSTRFAASLQSRNSFKEFWSADLPCNHDSLSSANTACKEPE